VRFAAAWLIPTWLFFEMLPTKLPHYLLPAYAALAWLAARALAEPLGRWSRWIGAALCGLVGLALAGATFFYLIPAYGDPSDLWAASVSGALLAGAGLVGGYLMLRNAPRGAVGGALVLSVLGHGALAAALAPRLDPLWLSARVEKAMGKARLLPRQGVAGTPVAVAGYAEPSLVFALGTDTQLDGPYEAAQAIGEGRPAIVEQREDLAFHQVLAALRLRARQVAEVPGLDYSNGRKMRLRVYVSPSPAPKEEAP
jgi:4-amino-4-deoxy-L-arabinose transferase-like glycosyltransferase